jgi:hypothetical protein
VEFAGNMTMGLLTDADWQAKWVALNLTIPPNTTARKPFRRI